MTNIPQPIFIHYDFSLQLTAVNHYLDLSIVYGNSDDINQGLRTFEGGQLRTDVRNGRQWLPRNDNVTGVCTVQSEQEACYAAGKVTVYYIIL